MVLLPKREENDVDNIRDAQNGASGADYANQQLGKGQLVDWTIEIRRSAACRISLRGSYNDNKSARSGTTTTRPPEAS